LRRANGQTRHDEVVQIAGALFAEHGFLATTTRDIATAANILSGSLYHHFTSKEQIADELLTAYWTELLSEYHAVVAARLEPPESARGLIAASIRMLEHHEFAVRMVLNDWSYLSTLLPYLGDNLGQIRKIWIAVLRQGVKDGQFRTQVEPDVAYRVIMGSISGAGRWFRPGGRMTAAQLAEQMSDLFLSGVQNGHVRALV